MATGTGSTKGVIPYLPFRKGQTRHLLYVFVSKPHRKMAQDDPAMWGRGYGVEIRNGPIMPSYWNADGADYRLVGVLEVGSARGYYGARDRVMLRKDYPEGVLELLGYGPKTIWQVRV